jgi:hypothetical protein
MAHKLSAYDQARQILKKKGVKTPGSLTKVQLIAILKRVGGMEDHIRAIKKPKKKVATRKRVAGPKIAPKFKVGQVVKFQGDQLLKITKIGIRGESTSGAKRSAVKAINLDEDNPVAYTYLVKELKPYRGKPPKKKSHMETVKLTPAQVGVLQQQGLDQPIDADDRILWKAWKNRGNKLIFARRDRDAIWSALVNRSNAEDAHAERGGGVYARRASISLDAISRKVQLG